MSIVRIEPIGGNTGRKEYVIDSNGKFSKYRNVEADDHYAKDRDPQGNVVGTNRSKIIGQIYGLPDVWELETGRITDINLKDRGIRVRVDGNAVASSAVGNTVEIRPRKNLHGASYSFNATGGISPSETPDLEPDDTIHGDWVTGNVYSLPDSYAARGSLWNFSVPDGADITVNGQVCNKKLVIVPQNSRKKHYKAHVSGEIVGMDDCESHDSAVGGVAEGIVYGSADTYRYSGQFQSIQGDVDGFKVFADGKRVDSPSDGPGDQTKLKEQDRYSGKTIGIAIRTSEELHDANGRIPERMAVRALSKALDEHNWNYRIWYNFPPVNASSEIAGCHGLPETSLGDFARDMKTSDAFIAKDANLLLLNDSSGGCARTGKQFGEAAGGPITEMRSIPRTAKLSNLYWRAVRAILHEVHHMLGGSHSGQNVMGYGYRDDNNAYHFDAAWGGDGVRNECGHMIQDISGTRPRVMHLEYSPCAGRHFEVV